MKNIKFILFSLAIIISSLFMIFHFMDNNAEEDQKKIAFMELIQTLSPAKKFLEGCSLKKQNNCGELENAIVKKTSKKENLYFVSGVDNLFGINFSKMVIVNLKYDKGTSEWKCFGWPQMLLLSHVSLCLYQSKENQRARLD